MTLQEIHEALETLPSVKAKYAEESLVALQAMELKEIEYNKAYAERYRELADADYTATAIKSILGGVPELIELRKEIIRLKYVSEDAKMRLTTADDMFTGAKLKARLTMSEIGGGLHVV